MGWLKSFSMRWGRGGSWRMSWGSGRRRNEYKGRGDQASVVMAPLGWLCRTFPEAPMVVEQRKGREWEIDEEHELTALLQRPNPYYSGDLLWNVTIAELHLEGNAYWLKVRRNDLSVKELWWAPSALLEPAWPAGGAEFISHYVYKPDGIEEIRVERGDVVHFRLGVDSDNLRKGLSPLRSVLTEILGDEEAATWASAILRNMGVPGLLISPDGDYEIPDDDFEAIKEDMKSRFTGDRRGEPFVTSGRTKVEQFGFSPKEMDVRSLRRVPEERVSAVLGVPAIVAGLGAGLDRSTFANMAEAREMAYESAVIPLQRLCAAELSHQLLVDFVTDPAQWRVCADLSGVRVLQEDQNKITERKLKELTAGAITLGTYLRETGRESGAEHEVYLRAMSVVEVPAARLGVFCETCGSSTHSTEQHEERRALAPPAVPALPPASEDADPPTAPDPDGPPKQKSASQAQNELMRLFMAQVETMADWVAPGIEGVFERLGDEAAAAFAQIGKSRKNDAHLTEMVLGGIDLAAAEEGLAALLSAHYRRVSEATTTTFSEVFGIGVNLPDPVMRQIIADGGKRMGLIDIDRATREAIFRALSDGRTLGEGPDALARRIRNEVPAGRFPQAGSSYRSRLIARTETKWAQNVSAMAAYKEAGAERLLAFDAQGRGEHDEECRARNGTEFTYEEAQLELASEHPNGTLSFAPVFAEGAV